MSCKDMDLSHDRESFTSLGSKHRSLFIGLLTSCYLIIKHKIGNYVYLSLNIAFCLTLITQALMIQCYSINYIL